MADPGSDGGDLILQIACLVEVDGWGPEEGALCMALRRAADAAVRRLFVGGGEVELSVVLTDDAAMQVLNAQWRGKDRPTNVLSFPGCSAADIAGPRPGGVPLLLGDIVLALSTCRVEAVAQHKTLTDHAVHLVVHGVLHLLGHDHQDTREAERMEAHETAILAGLGIADPYVAVIDGGRAMADGLEVAGS